MCCSNGELGEGLKFVFGANRPCFGGKLVPHSSDYRKSDSTKNLKSATEENIISFKKFQSKLALPNIKYNCAVLFLS